MVASQCREFDSRAETKDRHLRHLDSQTREIDDADHDLGAGI